MEQLNVVECIIGIPAQARSGLSMLPQIRLATDTANISMLIKYFGQCRYLMQKEPEKYYVWLQTYEGEQANYTQIERKYCQMIFIVDVIFQKAGLEHEFKQSVAKGNEWLNLWKKTLKDND
tara:strand:+ start:54 stop:416 length:363 start_codon:yes stop_codon:yes gene_type:complete